jgi:hypothetical protein
MANGRKQGEHEAAERTGRTAIMHPIFKLPAIRDLIDGQVSDDAPLLQSLRDALGTPLVMDDETIARTIRVYRERLEFIPLFRQQLALWSGDPGNANLFPEIERLSRQVSTMEATANEILAVAEKLKVGTIEQMHKKSNLELGLEAMQRNFGRKP